MKINKIITRLKWIVLIVIVLFDLILLGLNFLANKDMPEANVFLGYLYKDGVAVFPKDEDKAKIYFLRAAKKDDAEGQCALGELYTKEGDYEQALIWYFKSALLGSQRCEINFSQLTFTHEDKVFESLLKFANQSNTFAEFSVGVRFVEGKGVEKNIKQGIFYLKKAASQGHNGAAIYLAGLYLKGDLVKQDFDEANKWLNSVKK